MRLWISILILLMGCSNTAPLLNTDKFYKRDMIAIVNNRVYEGVGTLPVADQYDFIVEARGDLDLFTMSTCEGVLSKESAWNVETTVPLFLWWGERKIVDKRKVKFTYKRSVLAKQKQYCPMILEGLDKDNGRHSWAFFDFEDNNKEVAYSECNFETKKNNGVGVCQTLEGSFVSLRFEKTVRVFFPTENKNFCEINKCECKDNKCYADGQHFIWRVPKKENVYRFVGDSEFRLTTIGFDDIPLRK